MQCIIIDLKARQGKATFHSFPPHWLSSNMINTTQGNLEQLRQQRNNAVYSHFRNYAPPPCSKNPFGAYLRPQGVNLKCHFQWTHFEPMVGYVFNLAPTNFQPFWMQDNVGSCSSLFFHRRREMGGGRLILSKLCIRDVQYKTSVTCVEIIWKAEWPWKWKWGQVDLIGIWIFVLSRRSVPDMKRHSTFSNGLSFECLTTLKR